MTYFSSSMVEADALSGAWKTAEREEFAPQTYQGETDAATVDVAPELPSGIASMEHWLDLNG
jgi:hypothetical protein